VRAPLPGSTRSAGRLGGLEVEGAVARRGDDGGGSSKTTAGLAHVGGKHAANVEKPGHRPIALPRHGGRDCGTNLAQRILKQAGRVETGGAPLSDPKALKLTAVARRDDDGSYWAEVKELPGCFGSGFSLDELHEALRESMALYLDSAPSAMRLEEVTLVPAPQATRCQRRARVSA
jgi:predicted RNase H-like HicB family nuclease